MSPISVPPPLPPPLWPMPKFKIAIEDLDHEGADIFLTAVQPKVALREAAIASFKQLYTPETAPTQLVIHLRSSFDSRCKIMIKVLSKFCLSCDRWKGLHTLVAAINRRKFISLLITSRKRPSVLAMRSWAF
jgi:hypothetical protein